MPKNIAVLGTGANGSAIAADLIKAGHDVKLIDQWPENVQAMRRQGLRIVMPDETLEVPVSAYHLCEVCTFAEQFDIVLLVVKAYDTRWMTQLIEPYLKADGLIAGVQNGMTTSVISSVVGAARTIGCVIEISSAMFEPGVVMRHSPPSRSWFAVGTIDPSSSGREREVGDLLGCAGSVEIVDNILATKWMKLVSNATTLVPTALLGLPMHEALILPGMRELMLRSGQEALDVGSALGHPLTPIFGLTLDDVKRSNRLVETLLETLVAGFTLAHTKTTVLQDWQKGRRSEVDDLNGLVASSAMALCLDAPVNGAILELARRVEAGLLRADPANLGLLQEMTAT